MTPAVFGLLSAIVERLRAWAERTGSHEGLFLAEQLDEQGALLRARAYRLIDEVAPEEAVEDRLRQRGHALELVNRAAAVLVAAGAGASMASSHPHQRLAREALFHLVQAQTPAVRAATVSRYAELAACGAARGAAH